MSAPAPNGNGKSSQAVLPWIAVALSVGAAFWSIANPRDDIKQEHAAIEALRATFKTDIDALRIRFEDKYLPLSVHAEYSARIDKDTQRLEQLYVLLRADVVPRTEHTQHWAEADKSVSYLRDNVVELRKDISGSYNIGKQLDNLQDQIKAMQGKIDARAAWAPKT